METLGHNSPVSWRRGRTQNGDSPSLVVDRDVVIPLGFQWIYPPPLVSSFISLLTLTAVSWRDGSNANPDVALSCWCMERKTSCCLNCWWQKSTMRVNWLDISLCESPPPSSSFFRLVLFVNLGSYAACLSRLLSQRQSTFTTALLESRWWRNVGRWPLFSVVFVASDY